MTQEEKELLLKDLSARIPYGLKASVSGYIEENITFDILSVTANFRVFVKSHSISIRYFEDIDSVMPYLRPMSSMTEEEKKEVLRIVVGRKAVKHFQVLPDGSIINTDAVTQDVNNFIMHWINFNKDTTLSYIDWLNAHYFDYRELIKKGLAIEAPSNMYNN